MSSHPPLRVKRKYVPVGQRPPPTLDQYALNAHPHLTPEAKAHLFTVEDLIARSSCTLADSMWATVPSQSKVNSRSLAPRQATNSSEIKIEPPSSSQYITQSSSYSSGQQAKMWPQTHLQPSTQPSVAPHLRGPSVAGVSQQAVAPHLRGNGPAAQQSTIRPESGSAQFASPHPQGQVQIKASAVQQYVPPHLRVTGTSGHSSALRYRDAQSPAQQLTPSPVAPNGHQPGAGTIPWNGPAFKVPAPAQLGQLAPAPVAVALASQFDGQMPSTNRQAQTTGQPKGPVLMSGNAWLQGRNVPSKAVPNKQGSEPVNQTNGDAEDSNEDRVQPIVLSSMPTTSKFQTVQGPYTAALTSEDASMAFVKDKDTTTTVPGAHQSEWGQPRAATSVVETAKLETNQSSPSAAPTPEDTFVAFMNNKKGPAITVPYVPKPPVRPNPNSEHPFVNPKYKLNGRDTGSFDSYIQAKKEAPVTNGKTYTFNGPAQVQNDMPERREGTKVWVDTIAAVAAQVSSLPAKKENVKPFNHTDPHTTFPIKVAKGATENGFKAAQLNENRPVVDNQAGRWVNGLSDRRLVEEMINEDLQAQGDIPPTNAVLTQDALVKTTGFAPRNRSNSFDDKVSDAGVPPQSKERIRATQGKPAAQEILDWDGKTWLPPPCDWENARGTFDDSFIPDYIKEWSASLPYGAVIDMSTKEFLFGKHPIDNEVVLEPIDFPDSIPDLKYAEDEQKRAHQTVAIEVNNYAIHHARRQKIVKQVEEANRERVKQIEAKEPEQNPFAPSIAMYLRPAMDKDAAAIATIYNYYVNNSILPEDQEVLQEGDVLAIIQGARSEKLPFIVAVRGREPPVADALGRPGVNKPILPQFESIIGFAFTEVFNYGFSGSRLGRSRATTNLQLYVHNDYAHKGIGRNLLDRLIHSMTPAHSFKNAACWMNPEDDKTYNSENLVKWHQMFFQLPVDGKDDKHLHRVREFLAKFYFHQVALLRAAVRKSIHPGPAKFLDLVIFQAEATQNGDFDAYI